MSVVICEDDKKANLLLDQSPRCLRKLITIKEVSPSTHQRAKSRGVEILKFTDVEIMGAHKDHPCVVSIDSGMQNFSITEFKLNFYIYIVLFQRDFDSR